MRVPRLNFVKGANLGYPKLTPIKEKVKEKRVLEQPKTAKFSTDTVSFSSTAQYLKKYSTLPDEIKKVLSPKDAIDMFKTMELVANGTVSGQKVGEGNYSNVYQNPWLIDYYMLVLNETGEDTQIIYSNKPLGDAVWFDGDDVRIQFIRKSA